MQNYVTNPFKASVTKIQYDPRTIVCNDKIYDIHGKELKLINGIKQRNHSDTFDATD